MRRKWKFIIGLLLVAVLVVAAGYWFIQWRANEVLQRLVNEHTVTDVFFSYNKLTLDIWSGSALMTEVSLERHSGDTLEWSFKAESIEVLRFKYIRTEGENAISISSLAVKNPSLELRVPDPDFHIFTSVEGPEAPGKISLHQFRIASVFISEGNLAYSPAGAQDFTSGFEFSVSSVVYLPPSRQLDWQNAHLGLSGITYKLPGGIYTVEAGGIQVDDSNKALQISNVKLYSNLGKAQFHEHFKHRKSRIAFTTPRIDIEGYQLLGLDTILVRKLNIERPVISLHRDNRLPFPDRVTSLPQQMLADLPFKLRVDSVIATGGKLDIELVGQLSQPAERIYFDALSAHITSLQNLDHALPAFAGIAKGKFLDECLLTADFAYHFGEGDPWILKAVANELDLTRLNNILNTHVGFELESGEILEMYLTISGDRYHSRGDMILHYQNLHIMLGEHVDEEKSNFFSFLVDKLGGLLYKKENPANEVSRQASFTLERNVQKDFIGQWLDALLEGATITVSKLDTGKIKSRKLERETKKSDKTDKSEQAKENRREKRAKKAEATSEVVE